MPPGLEGSTPQKRVEGMELCRRGKGYCRVGAVRDTKKEKGQWVLFNQGTAFQYDCIGVGPPSEEMSFNPMEWKADRRIPFHVGVSWILHSLMA